MARRALLLATLTLLFLPAISAAQGDSTEKTIAFIGVNVISM